MNYGENMYPPMELDDAEFFLRGLAKHISLQMVIGGEVDGGERDVT